MSNHIEKIAEMAIGSVRKPRHLKNSTFIGGVLPTLLATLILFVATMIVGGPEHLPSWFSWIMLIVFSIGITYTLVIAQKRHLVGEYGETILILIPTFVWLMGGTFIAQEVLLYISLVLVIVGFVLYLFAKLVHSKKNVELGMIRVQLIIRLAFVAITVAATVVISLILLNWAYGSVHFQQIKEVSEVSGEVEIKNDYASNAQIMFIAVVTILSAVLLVMIGLTRKTAKDAKWFRLPTNIRHMFKKSKVESTVIFELKPRKQYRKEKGFFKKR